MPKRRPRPGAVVEVEDQQLAAAADAADGPRRSPRPRPRRATCRLTNQASGASTRGDGPADHGLGLAPVGLDLEQLGHRASVRGLRQARGTPGGPGALGPSRVVAAASWPTPPTPRGVRSVRSPFSRAAAARAWSKSAIRSSGCSSPTEMRTSPSAMPSLGPLGRASGGRRSWPGGSRSVSGPPSDRAMRAIRGRLAEPRAASSPPATSMASSVPPDAIWRLARSRCGWESRPG